MEGKRAVQQHFLLHRYTYALHRQRRRDNVCKPVAKGAGAGIYSRHMRRTELHGNAAHPAGSALNGHSIQCLAFMLVRYKPNRTNSQVE